MFHVDKSVFSASNINDGAGYFVNYFVRFKLPEVEISILLLPKDLFDILLNGVDDSVE